MATTLYCTYCGSSNLTPYLTIYKCLDCGRIVRNPISIEDSLKQLEEIAPKES